MVKLEMLGPLITVALIVFMGVALQLDASHAYTAWYMADEHGDLFPGRYDAQIAKMLPIWSSDLPADLAMAIRPKDQVGVKKRTCWQFIPYRIDILPHPYYTLYEHKRGEGSLGSYTSGKLMFYVVALAVAFAPTFAALLAVIMLRGFKAKYSSP